MSASGDRGYGGEQNMGFYWGERGYFLIDGPSGAAGHAGNAAGFDGVAYNPATGHMVIYDNKAYARAGKVYDASAISTNLAKNLDSLIAKTHTLTDMPRQQDILRDLTSARAAVGNGSAWPKNVQIAVSNASGQSTGVGGKLEKAGVVFINYNAAPSPRPAPPRADAQRGTSASTGTAWEGPGGTPGFDDSKINGIAGAIKELWAVAEKMSMMIAAREALADIKAHENEIAELQAAYPMYHIWLTVSFTYSLGNGEQPKIYRYLAPVSIKVGGSAPKMQIGRVRDFHQNLLLPAVKSSVSEAKAAPASAPSGPAWMSTYATIKMHLEGDSTSWRAENPGRAHQYLNGCPMPDMLAICAELLKSAPQQFRLLENTVWNPYGIYNARNAAAIQAARVRTNSSGDKFADFKAACKELPVLPDDQQKAIQQFLAPPKADDGPSPLEKARALLPGTWDVWIGNKGEGWNGLFSFSANGQAAWASKDAPGSKTWGGWSINKSQVAWKYNAAGDIRTFVVGLPLVTTDAKGVILPSGQGWFSMSK